MNFFKSLYENCEGKLELRALPSSHRAFFELTDYAAIARFCKQNKKDNLYFGVATRDGHGGKKENIVDIPALWSDVDFKDTPREVLKDLWKQLPFKPSSVIISGNGVHIYFFLKEPTRDIEVVEDLNKRLAAFFKGDMNACDASRILRIPGTTNYKYPATVKIAKLNDYRYELDDFSFLPEVEKPKTYKKINTTEIITQCDFVNFCKERPSEVSEPLWFALISNVVCVRPGGYSLCHELSKNHPKYNRTETDAKILHVLNGPGPHTCEFIRMNGFKCERKCKVKAPIGLLHNKKNGDPNEQKEKRACVSFI